MADTRPRLLPGAPAVFDKGPPLVVSPRSMAKGAQSKDNEGMKLAWKLFDAGDKLAARRLAERTLKATRSPASSKEAEEARDLLDRTEPPPLFWMLLAMSVALIAGLILLAVARG